MVKFGNYYRVINSQTDRPGSGQRQADSSNALTVKDR